jgi:hypothetical protein
LSNTTQPPKCFISYSWDNDAHKDWVRKLADGLKRRGVTVLLDQYDVHLGMDLAKYMESAVRESDFVLLICTPRFAEKANAGSGGVGYEKTIVTGEIFSEEGDPGKFVPVLRAGTPRTAVPSYLKTRAFIDFRDSREFSKKLEELRQHLFRRDGTGVRRPPAGDGKADAAFSAKGPRPTELLTIHRKKIRTRLYTRSSLDPSKLFLQHCEAASRGETVVVGWNVRPVPFLSAVHFAYLQQLSRLASFGFKIHVILYDLCSRAPYAVKERDLLSQHMTRQIARFRHLQEAQITTLSELLKDLDGSSLFAQLFQLARPSMSFDGRPDVDPATALDFLVALIAEQRVSYDILLCGGRDASDYTLRLRGALSDSGTATNPLILEMPRMPGHSPENVEQIPNERDSLNRVAAKLRKSKDAQRSLIWHLVAGPTVPASEPCPSSVVPLAQSLYRTFRHSPFLVK